MENIKILSVLSQKQRCSTYGCRNVANIFIGRCGYLATLIPICEDCLKSIIEQVPEVLTLDKASHEEELEANDGNDENKKNNDNHIDFYICKKCGAKYPKAPEGSSKEIRDKKVYDFKAHCLNCKGIK